MPTRTRRLTPDCGAAAVEFALILPLFVMLVFGIISGGFAFERWISVTQAARETSRFAATLPPQKDAAGAIDMNAWFNQVKQVAVDTAGIDVSDSTSYLICIRFVNQGDTLPSTEQRTYGTLGTVPGNCTGSTIADDNTVQVLVARKADINIVLWSSGVDVTGQNTSRYEPRLT